MSDAGGFRHLSPPSDEVDRSSEDTDDEDEDGSEHSVNDEEPKVESLVAGRERRSNAGNRMATAIAHEGPTGADEDEELNAIFAEGADDAEFEDQEAIPADDDDDEDSSSSSDDENNENALTAHDDLAGEQELKKQERADKLAQKRKAGKGVPAPLRKRVKIQAPLETDEERRKRRKKSDRVSWVPSESDKPTRVSSRTLSVQNKSRTLASIKESSRRAELTREKMKKSEAKKKAAEKPPLTQADRMAEAARTEKINAKSVSRWEAMEEERIERQRAELERMRNKKLEGPVTRWYSGPTEWSEHWDNKEMRYNSRVVSFARDEYERLQEEKAAMPEDADSLVQSGVKTLATEQDERDAIITSLVSPAGVGDAQTKGEALRLIESNRSGIEVGSAPSVGHSNTSVAAVATTLNPAMSDPAAPSEHADHSTDVETAVNEGMRPRGVGTSDTGNPASRQDLPSFLAGIEDYAAMDSAHSSATAVNTAQVPDVLSASTPVSQTEYREPSQTSSNLPLTASVPQQFTPNPSRDDEHESDSQNAESLLAAFAPRSGIAAYQAPVASHPLLSVVNPSAPPRPSAQMKPSDKSPKSHTGQSQSITLLNFSDSISRQSDTLRRIIFGVHYTWPERGKLIDKSRKAPPCAVSNHSARYRDPSTGLPYAGKEAFQVLRSLVRGLNANEGDEKRISSHNTPKEKPVRWSTLLNAWVGKEGTAAGGVPPGFIYNTIPLPLEDPHKPSGAAEKDKPDKEQRSMDPAIKTEEK